MSRLLIVRRVLWFCLTQIRHAVTILFALIRPSFDQSLEKSFSNYLAGVTHPFDQSSSNRAIGRLNPITSKNALVERLCESAAQFYAAPFARISLGGSSKSIRQIIGHVIPRARPGKSIILLDPACHKSVFGGLIESGHDIVFLRRELSVRYGVFGPIDEKHFRSSFTKHRSKIAAVLITDPTYEGFTADLSSISSTCKTSGVLLCVDCAWGSNFGIVTGLPNFPSSDADIVITSPHKKGGAPSQVGLVLFHSPLLAQLYDEASRAGYETTSPNWYLLLLFEHRLAEIAQGQWNRAWQKALREAAHFRLWLTKVDPKLECLNASELGYASNDPTHVFMHTARINVNGFDLARVLSDQFQIDAEMASSHGVLFLFGPAHIGKSAVLANAIKTALKRTRRLSLDVSWSPPNRISANTSEIARPRSAYFSVSQLVPLDQCQGRISASLVYAYPPGIPILAYGEEISADHVDAIKRLSKMGAELTGLPKELQIRVTRAPPTSSSDNHPSNSQALPDPQMKTLETSESLSIKGYPFGETPEDIVSDVARLFREIFCNPPYNQYVAHRDDPETPLSFADLAPAGYAALDDYQSLELLDAAALPPRHFRWMEPGEFEDRFRAKAHQLYIVTGHDNKTAELKAFIVCRVLTVRELFYTEEFRNPVYFSGREYLRTLRSAAEFYTLLQHHFGLSPDDKLWLVVGMGAHPSARGENFVFPGMNIISDHITDEHLELPSIGEVAASGAGRVHGEAVHEGIIYGVLQNDHALIYARTVRSVVENYRKGPAHVDALVKSKISIAREGYAPHVTDHPGVEIRQTATKGTGVFATRPINPGELIAEFIGNEYIAARESELPAIMADRSIQTGPTTYVFAENRLAEKINHSCQPNCGVREKTKIVAIYPIKAGEEICWDYRMSENSDWVLENCLCGTERCAHRIEGYDSLPEDICQEYLQKGAISTWLLDR